MIIGIAGRAQHGKDTIGKVLVEHYGYQRVAFADKVRELALIVDPHILCPADVGMEFRYLSELVRADGWDRTKQHSRVRWLLQRLGEGARNALGEDVWVNAAFNNIHSGNYVVTDVRYQNEVNAIRNRGGKVWRVTRPDFDNGVDPNHPSEANVALLDVDVDIANDGTVEDLAAKVAGLMEVVRG